MRIYLIGFMGSGKTTIGKQVATKLNHDFIDQDQEIEKQFGMEVSKIFEVHGEKVFREAEHQFLQEFSKRENVVISTGGGAPCFYDNMEIMNQTGLTVYLNVEPKILVSRLKESGDTRPLIHGKTETELFAYVQQKLKEREVYYAKARLSVKAVNIKASDILTMLNAAVSK